MLALEASVEIFRNLLTIDGKGLLYALLDIDNGSVFVEVKAQVVDFGIEEIGLCHSVILDGHDVAFLYLAHRSFPQMVFCAFLHVDSDVVVSRAA